jgi:hypothetical protein
MRGTYRIRRSTIGDAVGCLGIALVVPVFFNYWFDDYWWWWLFSGLVSVPLTIYALRLSLGCVKVDDAGVQIRNPLRTYKLTWSEIESFDFKLMSFWSRWGDSGPFAQGYAKTSSDRTIKMISIRGGPAYMKAEQVVKILNAHLRKKRPHHFAGNS